jgi:hypothetical protein
MEFDGFDEFIERRKKIKDKALEVAGTEQPHSRPFEV